MSIDQSRFDELAAELAALRAQVGPTPAVWTPPPPQYQPLPPSAIAQIRGHAERFRKGYRTIEWNSWSGGSVLMDPKNESLWAATIASGVTRHQEMLRVLASVEEDVRSGRLRTGERVLSGMATVVEPLQQEGARRLYAWDGNYVGGPSRLADFPVPTPFGKDYHPAPGPQVEHYVIVHEGWEEELDFAGVEYALPNGDPFPIRYSDGRSCLCHKAARS